MAEVFWVFGGGPVYKLQRTGVSKARYIATGPGGALYGVFIIEPLGQSQTRIVSYDFGAMTVNQKKQFDILSSW